MSIWKQLYQAYENKYCNTFKKLWANLSEEDKNSPYFSKYQSLLSKLCPPDNKKWKILLKWKTIKCPHCGSPISKSTFNLESIKNLNKDKKQLILFVIIVELSLAGLKNLLKLFSPITPFEKKLQSNEKLTNLLEL